MSQEFQAGLDVADVYAQALFELASAQGAEDAVYAELAGLVELIRSDRKIEQFFRADTIDDDDRAGSLERIFRGKISDTLLNTLQIMNARGRLGLLPQLRRALQLRIEQARGQIEVTATSAIELSAAQREEVARVAAELSGKQPLIEFVVDPTVLGGLVLQVGDYRLDNSVRRHLQAARHRLLERSSRGLDIARMEEL